MRHEVEVGGRVRRLSVVRRGEAYAVTLDGRTRLVDAVRTGPRTLSLLVDGMSYDVTVVPEPGTGLATVYVGAVPVPLRLNGPRRAPSYEDAGTGPQRITAPMPGRVARVLVRSGDAVEARQAVAVVEAMKMENELRAGRAGIVGDVCVSEGTPVDAGTLLMVIQ